jgi:hypothetical protein
VARDEQCCARTSNCEGKLTKNGEQRCRRKNSENKYNVQEIGKESHRLIDEFALPEQQRGVLTSEVREHLRDDGVLACAKHVAPLKKFIAERDAELKRDRLYGVSFNE